MTEREQGPDLRPLLIEVSRAWRIVAVFALLGALAGAVTAALGDREYQGSVTYFVSTPSAQSSQLAAGQFGQERVRTYVRLLKSERLAQMIVDESGREDLTARTVTRSISGNADLDTVLLEVTVSHPERETALAITRSLTGEFSQLVADLEGAGEDAAARVELVVVSGPSVTDSPVGVPLAWAVGVGGLGGILLGAAGAVVITAAHRSAYAISAPGG